MQLPFISSNKKGASVNFLYSIALSFNHHDSGICTACLHFRKERRILSCPECADIACLLFSAGTYTEGGFTCRPQRTLHVESLGCSFASSVDLIIPHLGAFVKRFSALEENKVPGQTGTLLEKQYMFSTYFNCLWSGCLYRSIGHPLYQQLYCRIVYLFLRHYYLHRVRHHTQTSRDPP